MKYLKFILKTGLFGLIQLPFMLLGLIVVPLALPFAKEDIKTLATFKSYPHAGWWVLKELPIWAYPWSNSHDGSLGDKRGWWANEFDFKHDKFWPQFRWLVIRNPINNILRSKFFSCPVSQCDIEYQGKYLVSDHAEEDGLGWQFVTATHKETKKTYSGFYAVYLYPGSEDKGWRLRTGFKIKPSHNSETEDKGFGITFTPYKSID